MITCPMDWNISDHDHKVVLVYSAVFEGDMIRDEAAGVVAPKCQASKNATRTIFAACNIAPRQ